LKKTLVLQLALLGSLPLFAAPIGNPASPTLIQQGVFIDDTVWCQPRASFLENFTLAQQLFSSSAQNTLMRSTAMLGAVTWSIRERFDLSLVLGTGQNYFRLYKDSQLLEFRSSGGLVWYGEGKLILLEVKDTMLSIFGAAGGWDWMEGPAYRDAVPQMHNTHLKMRFWQAGVALTQQIGTFAPYFGVGVLRSRWKLTETSSQVFRLSQKYTAGPFLGCTFSAASQIALNIEWRGQIENAWTVSGEVRF
jgi:hypothetical protein